MRRPPAEPAPLTFILKVELDLFDQQILRIMGEWAAAKITVTRKRSDVIFEWRKAMPDAVKSMGMRSFDRLRVLGLVGMSSKGACWLTPEGERAAGKVLKL